MKERPVLEINRQTAVVFGALLIAALVCGVFSSVPAIEKPDYLRRLASIEPGLFTAVIFQALMAIVYMTIAVITYPIVKFDSRTGAHAYFAFRATGAAFLFVGVVSLLLLLAASRQYSMTGVANAASLETAGGLIRQARDWLNHIGMVLPWCTGGFFLYRAFLRLGLIPRWLSIWGLIATALTLVATILYMLDWIQLVSITYFALNIPTVLLELVLAGYLITKGFRPASLSLSQVESR
jgi:hypothetical protein